jgi:hypothetical protein
VSKSTLEASPSSKLQKNGQTETSVLLAAHVAEPGEVGEAHIMLEALVGTRSSSFLHDSILNDNIPLIIGNLCVLVSFETRPGLMFLNSILRGRHAPTHQSFHGMGILCLNANIALVQYFKKKRVGGML